MSVILDALKRVQDENHRRGTAPGTVTDYEPVEVFDGARIYDRWAYLQIQDEFPAMLDQYLAVLVDVPRRVDLAPVDRVEAGLDLERDADVGHR